jgi:hypothetical protein
MLSTEHATFGRLKLVHVQHMTRASFRSQILPKFYYAKRRFPVTSKCRQMYGVLNVDEIKN